MQADPQTAAAVQAAIKGFTDKYQARTLNDLMAGIAPDADVVFYGTGKDERRQGLDEICSQIQRDWSQTETMRLSFSPGPISAAGPVAWTAMEGVCHFRTAGQNLSWPLRVSFVFENRSGQWLMAHAHFSTPAAGQDEGSSI